MKHFYLKHLLLCLCLFIGTKSFAYDAYVGGIYYNFSGNEAEVTYNDGYNSYSGSVVIPASVIYNDKTYSVKRIGIYAFMNCTGLNSISIPSSVTNIKDRAFQGCTSLTSITIPNSVTTIDWLAFGGCI